MDYEAQKLFEKMLNNPRSRALVDKSYGLKDVIIPEVDELDEEE
jgi:hypothetical protein